MTDVVPSQLETSVEIVDEATMVDARLQTATAAHSTSIDLLPHTTTETILADRYLIRSVLGRGGFGITFLARNLHLPGEPLCAIKQFIPRVKDPHQIEIAHNRFYLEAHCLSRLGSHAQIPTLLDYFAVDTDLYLVEEYIPGVVLTQLVSQQQIFTESDVENFLIQMLRLLEYIHGHRLIHRDIKPQNIILCQTDRRFVLVDFGAVKDLDPISTERKQSHIVSQSIGTPGFAPPEQLANRTVFASDLYALGMTCLYLLTGKEPTQFPTDPYTCELLWADSVEMSADFSEIISKMVQVSLADRFHSASQVLTALDHRSVRATLRAYMDRKHEIAKTEHARSPGHYPAVVNWALGI